MRYLHGVMADQSVNCIYVPLILEADRQARRLQNRESEPPLVFSQPDDGFRAILIHASQVLEFYMGLVVESPKSFLGSVEFC